MRLYHNPASPFVRKVLVAAHELGLARQIEMVACATTPIGTDAALSADNPLGKIPCLVTDDGDALYDSRVICEYLDGLDGRARLFPPAGDERWTALRRQALGDGIMDAGVAVRYETFLRPQERQWEEWIAGQKAKFRRALDTLEHEAGDLASRLDIGTIAIGCALGYLDFRYPDEGWRASRPGLAAWFDDFARRPSMVATTPT